MSLAKPADNEDESIATPRSGLARRFLLGLIALALVAAGVTFGVRTVVFYAHHIETDDAQVEAHIDPVLPRVAGFVASIRIVDNQRVREGDVLLTIDSKDLNARLDQAQAALENARAQVAATEANLRVAEANLQRAREDVTRYEPLVARQELSRQQFDAARTAAEAAEAERDSARRQISAARAGVAQKAADVDWARLQIAYATVAAPASGTVSKKNVEVGQFVQAGQPLLAIVQDGEVWVVANFKETQLGRMRAGQDVDISVDAYPKHVFHGRVDSFAAATGAKFSLLPPDNATGNFTKVVQRVPVKIVLTDPADPARPLRAGMSVTAIVKLS